MLERIEVKKLLIEFIVKLEQKLKQMRLDVVRSTDYLFGHSTTTIFMRGSRKFCQRGSDIDFLFLVDDEGREDPNTTIISGPSLARQRNAIYMAFRWCADDGATLNAGLVAL